MVVVNEAIWDGITRQLQSAIGQPHYDLWIRPLKFDGLRDQTALVLSPNDFHLDYVRRNYGGVIEKTLAGAGYNLELGVAPAGAEQPSPLAETKIPATVREQPDRPKAHPLLNAQYTFETFVVGTSNQVAHASASSVALNLGRAFNPLFLVGGSGLGKTHLLHAIGHEVYRNDSKKRIHCLSAERFMNLYVTSIQRGNSMEFKEKFRECDLLLIDDVHTFAGREGTQEEFFHIFNFLHEKDKQIVLTSDKYPRDMPGLEHRLRSRFEWGLIADIQPPEAETRIAIIRRKAELAGMALPDDVAYFLAGLTTSSVRDLEGHLTRLRAFSNFENRPIDLEFARRTLAGLMGTPRVRSSDDIIKAVADAFNVRVQDLRSASRKAAFTEPRHVAMFLTRELMNLSYPEIGQRFGGRNHATVINACDNVRNRMLTDQQFAALVNQLKRTL